MVPFKILIDNAMAYIFPTREGLENFSKRSQLPRWI
jgi:hypothetical protein